MLPINVLLVVNVAQTSKQIVMVVVVKLDNATETNNVAQMILSHAVTPVVQQGLVQRMELAV